MSKSTYIHKHTYFTHICTNHGILNIENFSYSYVHRLYFHTYILSSTNTSTDIYIHTHTYFCRSWNLERKISRCIYSVYFRGEFSTNIYAKAHYWTSLNESLHEAILIFKNLAINFIAALSSHACMSQGHKKNVSNTIHAKSPNGPSADDSSSFLGRHIIDISISHSKRSFIRTAWLYRTDRKGGGGARRE